jgi:hypothetical protein
MANLMVLTTLFLQKEYTLFTVKKVAQKPGLFISEVFKTAQSKR